MATSVFSHARRRASVDAVTSAITTAGRRAKQVLTAGATVFALAFSAMPAGAGDLPNPTPFAKLLPARAGECVAFDEMAAHLAKAVGESGGRGLVLTAGLQQDFANRWRLELNASPASVSATLVWLKDAAVIAEFDAQHCLLTITKMSVDEFVRLVQAGRGEEA